MALAELFEMLLTLENSESQFYPRHGLFRIITENYRAPTQVFGEADIHTPVHTAFPSPLITALPPGCVEQTISPELIITQLPLPHTTSPFLFVVIVPPGGAQTIFPELF